MKKSFLIGVFSANISGIFGMNVQDNSNDEFIRRMTEILTNTSEQHKQEMTAIRAENATGRELNEQNAELEGLLDRMLTMQDRHRHELEELHNRHEQALEELRNLIKKPFDQAEIEKEIREILKQPVRPVSPLSEKEIRSMRRAETELLKQIERKQKEIHYLDITYNMYTPLGQHKTFPYCADGTSPEHDEFYKGKREAERRIPQLREEIEVFRKELDSLRRSLLGKKFPD